MNKVTCLELSTGHVTKATAEWLDEQGELAARDPRVVGRWADIHMARHVYGWFVWVGQDPPEEVPEDLPVDLEVCAAYARQQGCSWLLFDADAELIPELPKFNW